MDILREAFFFFPKMREAGAYMYLQGEYSGDVRIMKKREVPLFLPWFLPINNVARKFIILHAFLFSCVQTRHPLPSLVIVATDPIIYSINSIPLTRLHHQYYDPGGLRMSVHARSAGLENNLD